MKIETQRLILRPPQLSDWKDLVEGLNNLNVSKNLLKVKYPYTRKEAMLYLKKCTKPDYKKGGYNFYIELKSEKKIIGAIVLDIDEHNKIAKTGSWVNEKYHKKGYMTEAKIAVNNLAFNKLKLRKLETTVFSNNIASNATQKRVGYKIEGMMRKHGISIATGKIHDENMYGLLKEEWLKIVPELKTHLKEKIKKLKE